MIGTHKLEGYEFASLLNEFAFKLYNNSRRSDQNLVLSPAQLLFSLGIIAIASDNQTEKQFQKFIGYGDPHRLGGCLQQGLKEVLHWVAKISLLSIKMERSLILKKQFFDILEKMGLKQAGLIETVDFVKGSQGFRNQLNEQTAELLLGQTFLPEGELNSFTRMIIVNALHFDCEFQLPFAENLTTEEPFVVSNLSTNHRNVMVPVMMMNQIGFFKLFDDKIASFLSLPLMKDCKFHLDIVIPKIHIQEYETIFNHNAYVQYLLQSTKTKVHLKLPRFRIQPPTTQKVKAFLKDMGISDVFANMKADLSKIDQTKSAFLTEIFSHPIISVHEQDMTLEQTLEIPKYTQPPLMFTVNRPFLYFVRETATNSILLMGKLLDPQQMN